MSLNDYPMSVSPGAARSGVATKSPDPPPGVQLSPVEREIWDYICRHLREAGIEHLTSGMTVVIVARTYVAWEESIQLCLEKGRVQISKKNGYATPYPWANDEQRLKMELGQWLPKLCLTIPSLQRVRKDAGPQGQQDDLFASLVNHATSSPQKSSRH
ncbi:hypothetical protein ASD15_21980 [Massilia sp. Root351]|jgi:hypothetical protein|uniref:hypothetical protein n=1 Tax=Massilia sp. Root351 TaxID=1736522 RepID=UPI00071003D5|nr:hypothetical protein [Massilia sp. Root351]KQV78484.1 hypothetical protein ASD15_21980 [Massilia sp. Root351]